MTCARRVGVRRLLGALSSSPQRARLYASDASLPQTLVHTELLESATLIALRRASKRNAVSHHMLAELRAALRRFESSNSCAAIIYGDGGNFSSGEDLEEVASNGVVEHYEELLTMFPLSKPVIAAVSGCCFNFALALALAADLRFADHTASFGLPGRRFGIPFSPIAAQRLVACCGLSRANHMVASGVPISGADAERWGLIGRLCKTGTVLGEAVQLVAAMERFGQESLNADRLACYGRQARGGSREQLMIGAALFVRDQVGRHGSFKLVSHETDRVIERMLADSTLLNKQR